MLMMAMLIFSCAEKNERPQSQKRAATSQKTDAVAELSMGKVYNTKVLPIDNQLIQIIEKRANRLK